MFMNKKTRDNGGITLVALVVTIIVLLILAGVSIATLTGDNGILTRAQEAKEKTEEAAKREEAELADLNSYIDNNGAPIYDTETGANNPVLTNGMIPVKYDAEKEKWIICSSTDKDWYSYSEDAKQWANVMLSDGKYYASGADVDTTNKTIATKGTEVAKEDLGSMFVWIPRYSYYIDNSKNMDVKFLVGRTNTYYDKTTGEYKELSNEYKVHPSFQNGSSTNYANGEWKEEILGFWIAKFQAGLPDESTAPKTTSVRGMTNSYYPVFQGQKGAYNYIDISQCFLLSKALVESGNPYGITNADSHLTKNSEWGAVAYLSYSKYGKTGGTYATNKEVYINNVTYGGSKISVRNYGVYAVTGYAGNTQNAGANTLTAETNLGDTVGTTSYAWYTTNGQQASTTGTIYGVYDMSGTLSEYTSGYMKQENNSTLLSYLKNYGYGFIFTDSTKTTFVGNTPYVTEYPAYESGGFINALKPYNRYGDALLETWGWFGDWTDNNASGPFTARGAAWYYTSGAGVFAFDDNVGYDYYNGRFPFCFGWCVAL